MDNLYVFSEKNVSNYEATIYMLGIAFGCESSDKLTKDTIYGFANFLNVDSELLYKAINPPEGFTYKSATIKIGDKIIEGKEFFDYTFFDNIIKLFYAFKSLDEIFIENDEDFIIQNIKSFRDNIHHSFAMINSNISTYECMKEGCFSYKNTMYDSYSDFLPKTYLDMLALGLEKDYLTIDEAFIPIVTELFKYEYETRLNVLLLITICQIIKYSPCFSDDIKDIAVEMYNKFLPLLKNGKIIALNSNTAYFDITKEASIRSKKDNTTRIQIIYGYSNYDCYELRLDFPHKGQEFVHFNNQSPGGVSCCIFSDSEYLDVIKYFPQLKECFIQYDDRWALKEKCNCTLTKELNNDYETICDSKAHDAVFLNCYSEESLKEFIEIFSNMLPPSYKRRIDLNGKYAKDCFNYASLIFDITILASVCYTPCNLIKPNYTIIDKIITMISSKAYHYGLIPKTNDKLSLEEILNILQKAKSLI